MFGAGVFGARGFGLSYVAVSGRSMEPRFHHGDWLLACRTHSAKVGDVVVVEHPDRPGLLLLKRVAEANARGFWVLGDNPGQSTDSRHFGSIRQVHAKVLWRVRPWGRPG